MGQQDPNDTVQQALKFFDMRHFAEGWRGQTLDEKFIDVSQGQFWRVFTPAFLHGSVWHLALNMVMFYRFAASIEHRRGTWRLGLLILFTAVVSNLAQAAIPNEWGGTANFVGLSGVVFGLFGYTWMKSRYQPQLGLFIDRYNTGILLGYLVLGFVGVFNVGNMRIANWAHGVGFLAGVVVGLAPVLWRRTQQT
jgi:GlpG protein